MGLCYNDRNSFNRFNISGNKGDKLMINGIKPRVSESDFNVAVNRLVYNIDEDYKGWKSRSKYDDMPGAFPDVEIVIKPGRKFIKIIRENSVWGFVAKVDGTHKGVPMKIGDVLKAAGWSAPAKHTRGNIFDDNQDYFSWTGPNYR